MRLSKRIVNILQENIKKSFGIDFDYKIDIVNFNTKDELLYSEIQKNNKLLA